MKPSMSATASTVVPGSACATYATVFELPELTIDCQRPS